LVAIIIIIIIIIRNDNFKLKNYKDTVTELGLKSELMVMMKEGTVKKWVFGCFLKLLTVATDITVGGRLFQTRAAAAQKVQSPRVYARKI